VNTYYSPAKSTLVADLALTESEGTLFNTFGLFFAALGAVVAKPLVKFTGRRTSTFINNAVWVVSYIVLAVAKSKGLALTMRAFQGVSTGVNGPLPQCI
jgi:MFS family permease